MCPGGRADRRADTAGAGGSRPPPHSSWAAGPNTDCPASTHTRALDLTAPGAEVDAEGVRWTGVSKCHFSQSIWCVWGETAVLWRKQRLKSGKSFQAVLCQET